MVCGGGVCMEQSVRAPSWGVGGRWGGPIGPVQEARVGLASRFET